MPNRMPGPASGITVAKPVVDDVVPTSESTTQRLLGQLIRDVAELRDIVAGKRKEHFTVEEIAEMTGRCAYSVRRWISEGRLAAQRITGTGPRGRLLVHRDEVKRLIAQGLGAKVPSAAIG